MTSDTTPQVRVRFAPSPTGYLHVGGARTALFNYLYARHTGGKFLLRIEDTDLERSTPESTQQILDSMEWLGLPSDEPVEYQTQRLDIHKQAMQRLLDSGSAYKCWCSKERLEKLREESKQQGRLAVYDKHCLLHKEEAAKHEAAGEPYVIRFNVPLEGVTAYDDLVYGRIEVANTQIGDFVLARPDGSPVYNFTNTVDDIDMRITHICRGEDHISNTTKQILIYRALGQEPPQFAHLPMILGKDKTRLSKRHGATGVMQFRDEGILPQALINYIVLLGWAPEGEFDEIMTMEQMTRIFSLEKVNRSPAVFDYEKLSWMNGVYIRNLDREQVYGHVMPILEEKFGRVSDDTRNNSVAYEKWLRSVIDLGVERSRTFVEFADILEYFFRAPSHYEEKGLRKNLGNAEQMQMLRDSAAELRRIFEENSAIEPHPLEEKLRAWGDARGAKFGSVVQPLRIALTGRTATVGISDLLYYIGGTEIERRVEAFFARVEQSAT